MRVTRIAIRNGKTPEGRFSGSSAMYRRIVERLETSPGVSPEDVLICVMETAADNWSFGNGEAQFYAPADRQPAPA